MEKVTSGEGHSKDAEAVGDNATLGEVPNETTVNSKSAQESTRASTPMDGPGTNATGDVPTKQSTQESTRASILMDGPGMIPGTSLQGRDDAPITGPTGPRRRASGGPARVRSPVPEPRVDPTGNAAHIRDATSTKDEDTRYGVGYSPPAQAETTESSAPELSEQPPWKDKKNVGERLLRLWGWKPDEEKSELTSDSSGAFEDTDNPTGSTASSL